jgi:hypothetical protein
MAVAFGTYGSSWDSSTTSILPAYPTGITAGMYLLATIATGVSGNAEPTASDGTWTKLATSTTTDGTFGVDTGPRRVTIFGKVAVGTETGTTQFNLASGNVMTGSISSWSNGTGVWSIATGTADDSNNRTAISAATASGAPVWANGDGCHVGAAQRVDTATVASFAVTASGATFGTITARETRAVTTGNDVRILNYTCSVTAGSASGATTISYTASAAASTAFVVVRLREATAGAPAGNASGSGVAYAGVGRVASSAGAASQSTGTAQIPATGRTAQAITATGTAYTTAASLVSPGSQVAQATGTAYGATGKINANAGVAQATGTAYGATVSTATNTNANAGVAQATGTAYGATVSTATNTNANAGVAQATGSAGAVRVNLAGPTGFIAGGTASQTYTTPAFTPPANCRILLVARAGRENHTAAFTWSVSDSLSGSWVQDALGADNPNPGNAFGRQVAVYHRNIGGSPASMTITVDAWATADIGNYGVVAYFLADGTYGGTWMAQTPAFAYAGIGSTSVVPALGGAASGQAIQVAFVEEDVADVTWGAPESGYTPILQTSDVQYYNARLAVRSAGDADGATTVTYSGVGVESADAVLLDVAPAGAVTNANAGLASGTGTAFNATITSSGNALAGLPPSTGTAQAPAVSVTPSPSLAGAAGGAALNATIKTGSTPGTAAGTGVSGAITAKVSPTARSGVQQLIIPMYSYPAVGFGQPYWDAVYAVGAPKIYGIVANPATGPGGTADPNYVTAIAAAQTAGIRVYGYVNTGYAAVADATVDADVVGWGTVYGIHDIFFDLVSAGLGDLVYYQARAAAVRSTHPGGALIFNPGASIAEAYVGLADIVCNFEGSQATYTGWTFDAYTANYPPEKWWHLVHGTPTTQDMRDVVALSKGRNVHWLDITDDTFSPGAWDTTPTYLSAEADQLAVETEHSAIGTARSATGSVRASIGSAAGTGSAYNATTTSSTNVPGGVASGTGSAFNATVQLGTRANAGLASGTGAGADASTRSSGNATPGAASGTGSAFTGSGGVGGGAGSSAGTGTASNATTKASGNATPPVAGPATGTAWNATAQTAGFTNAQAGLAGPAIGTAYNEAGRYITAEVALGTGTAYGVTGKVSTIVGVAQATGTALGATGASGVSPTAGTGTGSGTAYNATVRVASTAQVATATAAGSDPGVAIKVSAQLAGPVSGSALAPTVVRAVSPQAGVAAASAAAYNATVALARLAQAEAAFALGAANGAVVYAVAPGHANAQLAHAVAMAHGVNRRPIFVGGVPVLLEPQQLTVITPIQGGPDGFGNLTWNYAAGTERYIFGWIQQDQRSEGFTPGRDPKEQHWLLVTNDPSITARDRVYWGTSPTGPITFEVEGPPEPAYRPDGYHHTEATLRVLVG